MTDEQYYGLIRHYEDAGRVIRTRLEILNDTMYGNEEHCGPIHNIQGRTKTKQSIEEKLGRMGCDATRENARDFLHDIEGLRIICYFVRDIDNLVNRLKKQTDLVVIKEKDYIRNPKPNGYRSYHIVFGVPVYCLDVMEYYPVEIQLRTISMDFWASMEHRICYKKNPERPEALKEEFLEYSRTLLEMERQFEQYNGEESGI